LLSPKEQKRLRFVFTLAKTNVKKTMNIQEEYRKFCDLKRINFQLDDKVNPYNDTTLFCPAGMQQFKKNFNDKTYKGTISNIQSCIRMNDFDEIGDGSHLLYFNMIGLFSFRELSIKQAIDFWLEFLEDILSLKIDYVTIHPDKFDDWKIFYDKIEI
jgi:alanyl-tRNA synthetase